MSSIRVIHTDHDSCACYDALCYKCIAVCCSVLQVCFIWVMTLVRDVLQCVAVCCSVWSVTLHVDVWLELDMLLHGCVHVRQCKSVYVYVWCEPPAIDPNFFLRHIAVATHMI